MSSIGITPYHYSSLWDYALSELDYCIWHISADSGVFYVVPDGEGPDGLSWETAFGSLHDAVEVAGAYDQIVVTNGVYMITNEIVVSLPLTIRSVNGREVTTIQRVGGSVAPLFRLFTLDHVEAIIDGFTITGGWITSDVGGGVQMNTGIVRNSLISDNNIRRSSGDATILGAGIWMQGGRVENSIISNNRANGTAQPKGGGIYATGGVIDSCEIVGNEAWGSANSHGYGGGVYIGGEVLLINSTIASNDVRQGGNNVNSLGDGIYMSAGTIVNTIFQF